MASSCYQRDAVDFIHPDCKRHLAVFLIKNRDLSYRHMTLMGPCRARSLVLLLTVLCDDDDLAVEIDVIVLDPALISACVCVQHVPFRCCPSDGVPCRACRSPLRCPAWSRRWSLWWSGTRWWGSPVPSPASPSTPTSRPPSSSPRPP